MGGHYDATTSIFTCPVSGLYLFSATVYNIAGQYMHGMIMHEGEHVAMAYANTHTEQTGSIVANILCLQGDKVWVESTWGDSNHMIGDASNKRSVFSGLCVHDVTIAQAQAPCGVSVKVTNSI